MKKHFAKQALFTAALIIYGIMLSGCEGPKGPQGTEGPMGPEGSAGTATCGRCHNVSTTVLAKQIQWQASKHATGGHSGGHYASAGCAYCHSNEGFRLAIAGETVTGIDDATPPNCRTCHNIHTNYDETDYALSTTAPAEIMSPMMSSVTTIDIGKGNLCANCHQSRDRGIELAVGGGDFEIVRGLDPHHGPQANVFAGFGGFEVAGSETYTNSAHTTAVTDGCVTCHMLNDNHTFEPDTDACEVCHTDIGRNFDYRDTQTEISELLEELAVLLVADSLVVLDDDDPEDLIESDTIEDQTVSSAKAGAVLNFFTVLEDKSLGIHNAKYVKALLKNSIEALQ